jgi:hypothetical protein
VLSDLVRVLPVALLIGVLPGWFWTRCLLASEDYAERLAYAIALSLTLVPTAALVQVYLFGIGVTSTVATVSAVLVFVTGLAAYLALGPAKGAEVPFVRPPSPPRLPALVPLAAGLALALTMLSGVLSSEWLIAPIALLVLAAGAIYWWTVRQRDLSPEVAAEDSGPGISSATRYAILAAVLLLVLARGYLGPLVQGWPYPRGIDRYEHDIMADMVMTQGSTESFMLYRSASSPSWLPCFRYWARSPFTRWRGACGASSTGWLRLSSRACSSAARTCTSKKLATPTL